jgi:23S rRNA pseudouridine2605 synthase
LENLTVLKTLVLAGCGSRRAMADAIKQNRVSVNGVLVESFKQEFDPSRDTVSLDGKPVGVSKREHVYIMLNKPIGVLSTTSDDRGRRTVLELLPREYRELNLYPVGRLDMDSTGLLLLTDDGDLTFRLTHPKFEKEKEYVVTLDRRLDPLDKDRFEQGLELEDGVTWPTRVKETPGTPLTYHVILHEGRKRQVRRMFGSMGYGVEALQRIRIGKLTLGDLPEGQTRVLSKSEVEPVTAPEAHAKS